MFDRRLLVNAIIAALAAVALSFVPLSTLLGGAVGGFLQGADARDATAVGALAGLITLLPLGAIAFGVLIVLGIGAGTVGPPTEGLLALGTALSIAAAVTLVYTVGLGALGGFLGAVLAREYPERRRSVRESVGLAALDAKLSPNGREPRRFDE